MITAPAPIPPITVNIVRLGGLAALAQTQKIGGVGKHTVTGCRKTAPHYGQCNFTLSFKSKTGKVYNCKGVVMVRNVKGLESSYKTGSVTCNGVVVA